VKAREKSYQRRVSIIPYELPHDKPPSGRRVSKNQRSLPLRHSTTLTMLSSSLGLLRSTFMGYDVTGGASKPSETGIGSQRVQRSSMSPVSPLMGVNTTTDPAGLSAYLLRNLIRVTPSLKRTAVTVWITGLAYSAPQFNECLIHITGAACSHNHDLGALPQKVEGGFALGGCMYRKKPADQTTDISI
jgi:hypothetical protein